MDIGSYLKSSSNHPKYYLEPSLSDLPVIMSKTVSPSFFYQLANLSKTIPLRIERQMGYIKILPFSFQRRSEVYSSKASIYSKFDQAILNKLKDSDRYFLNCNLSWKSNKKFLLINIEASKEVKFEQFFKDYKKLIDFLFSEHQSKVLFDEKDWLNFLKDRHYEGYEDELPDPTPATKFIFNRSY
ncbi:MAG: hypothetical protein KC646_12640 [Candidatus Cloacimonetes bacterium]|nr:hypothetical protein [Candidatus Cloacimonadota bacterium]